MALEKPIIKANTASGSTFDYKPREIAKTSSEVARSFVNEDAFISTDFKISALVAQQAGISQLEDDAHRDKINSQVLEKLKEVQEKAYQEGYELGLIEGTEKAFQDAQTQLQSSLHSLESILKRVEDLKTQIFIDNEAEMIAFLFHIAKKIALRDIEGNREAVLEILKHSVTDTQADQQVTVRLNQADLTFIENLQDKTGKRIESLQRVKFIADEKVTPGGCLIETGYGEIDATLEERVERVWQTLVSRIPQARKAKKSE